MDRQIDKKEERISSKFLPKKEKNWPQTIFQICCTQKPIKMLTELQLLLLLGQIAFSHINNGVFKRQKKEKQIKQSKNLLNLKEFRQQNKTTL